MGVKVLGFSIPTAARTIRRMDTALFHRAEAIQRPRLHRPLRDLPRGVPRSVVGREAYREGGRFRELARQLAEAVEAAQVLRVLEGAVGGVGLAGQHAGEAEQFG